MTCTCQALLILETFARDGAAVVVGHEDRSVRGTATTNARMAALQCAERGWFGSPRTDSGCDQAVHAPQVEGKASKDGGDAIARGVEIAHAREAIAALESAEHLLDGAADQRARVVVLDRGRAERKALAPPAHQPVAEAAIGKVLPQPRTIIGAIAIDRASLARQQHPGDAHILNVGAG